MCKTILLNYVGGEVGITMIWGLSTERKKRMHEICASERKEMESKMEHFGLKTINEK